MATESSYRPSGISKMDRGVSTIHAAFVSINAAILDMGSDFFNDCVTADDAEHAKAAKLRAVRELGSGFSSILSALFRIDSGFLAIDRAICESRAAFSQRQHATLESDNSFQERRPGGGEAEHAQ